MQDEIRCLRKLLFNEARLRPSVVSDELAALSARLQFCAHQMGGLVVSKPHATAESVVRLRRALETGMAQCKRCHAAA
jgi:hypothetical protein